MKAKNLANLQSKYLKGIMDSQNNFIALLFTSIELKIVYVTSCCIRVYDKISTYLLPIIKRKVQKNYSSIIRRFMKCSAFLIIFNMCYITCA